MKRILVVLTLIIASAAGAWAENPSNNPGTSAGSRQSCFVDIAVDSTGALYVLDNGKDQVLKLDKGSKLQWKTPLAAKGEDVTGSYKLAPCTRGSWDYTVISNQGSIEGLNRDGSLIPLFQPIGGYTDRIAAVDGSGAVYYPNKEKNRIEVYRRLMINVTSDQLKDGNPIPDAVALPDPGPAFMYKENAPYCSLVIDGKAQKGLAAFAKPHMVIVTPGDAIWILDQSYVFNVFDGAGKFLYEVHAPDKKNRSFTYVVDAEFDSEGNTYLACGETKSILKYNSKGKLVKTIELGVWPKSFGLGSDGSFYVGVDAGYSPNDGTGRLFPAIKVFDQTGKQIKVIPLPVD